MNDAPLFLQRMIWRSQLNPLRGLVPSRVVNYLDNAERGIYSDLQWLYKFVEKRFPVLGACINRRVSALKKLEWDVRIKSGVTKKDSKRYQEALRQQAQLREAYEAIDNLKEAVEFMAMATFRGYAHLEKHFTPDGDVTHLEPVDQWFWSRRYPSAQWLYNWNATSTNTGVEIDYTHFIIREVPRPVDEIAVMRFVRFSLGEKDWDGYTETYGIPPLFIELPPGMAGDALDEFRSQIEKVISNGRGALPSGAKLFPLEPRDRTSPFKEYCCQQEEQVVLAATSGKLSILNDSTGMGSSQPDQHEDTFVELAEAEGADISECFQRQFDSFILRDAKEVLVYWSIAAKDQTDVVELSENVARFKTAGLEADATEISEKAGFKLTRVEQPQVDEFGNPIASPTSEPKDDEFDVSVVHGLGPEDRVMGEDVPPSMDDLNGKLNPDPTTRGMGNPRLISPGRFKAGRGPHSQDTRGGPQPYPLNNRRTVVTRKTQAAVRKAFADDFALLQKRVLAIANIEDVELRNKKLRDLSDQLPWLLRDLNADPAAAHALNHGAVTELVNSLKL